MVQPRTSQPLAHLLYGSPGSMPYPAYTLSRIKNALEQMIYRTTFPDDPLKVYCLQHVSATCMAVASDEPYD